MEKLTQFLFSMRMMAIGLIIFFAAIGTATFLEAIYDIQTAKIVIYNALWFEILLAFLAINLIANIFNYKMYMREKIAILMFHVAFIIILIGAAITRFISFEGLMQIPEGQETNIVLSSDPYLQLEVRDENQMLRNRIEEKMFMSEVTDNYFFYNVEFPKRKDPVLIEYMKFEKNMVDSLVVNDSIRSSMLEFIVQGQSFFVAEGDVANMNGVPVSFGKENPNGLEVMAEGLKLKVKAGVPMKFIDMSKLTIQDRQNPSIADSLTVDVGIDTIIPLETGKLYTAGTTQFVFKGKIDHAKRMMLPSGNKKAGTDIVTVKISDGSHMRLVHLKGGFSRMPERELFEMNGLVYDLRYGSKPIQIPFNVGCKDFQLDRYPGSNSPSSFASELYINDPGKNVRIDQRIFMNHVLDYNGYRFFQSSYFPDESGTILSVNHDWWGTNVTYFGYLLMSIAMIMSLFTKVGRVRELIGFLAKINDKRIKQGLSVLLVLLSFNGISQGHTHEQDTVKKEGKHTVMSVEHSEELESLLVQDFQGRIIPYQTFCDQHLRKLSRSNTYEGLNAVQVITSMHMYFDYWSNQDIIYVSKVLRDTLGIPKDQSLVSMMDLVTDDGVFKLMSDYEKAHRKLESKRGEYDKKLIKLEERFEVITSIFLWREMRIIPLMDDPNNTWLVPMSTELMMVDTMPSKIAFNYFNELDKAGETNNYRLANTLLNQLKDAQRKLGGAVVPSKEKVSVEITYNKMNVFKNTFRTYGLLGVVLLIIFLFRVFVRSSGKVDKVLRLLTRIIHWILVIVFLYHGAGLGMRWYITGHAPWSNGYEAVVFIAWITMLAGFIFSRRIPAVMAGATILAMFMLFVTEMNLLDPEITPLVPVLKSYWLMIHVAIITSSYGFLGIGFILGFLNMILYIFRTESNGKSITMNINELTYVSEISMTIGIFMLTIGTFLGGVWANESWGRYWGWDPKETWALVSILVYAVILHLRFIPGLKSKFTFNFWSLWGYSAILFTFFGVNFILTGLHSYAQGESLGKLPDYVIYIIVFFAIISLLAWLRNRAYLKAQSDKIEAEF